jgi:hypothetical protein
MLKPMIAALILSTASVAVADAPRKLPVDKQQALLDTLNYGESFGLRDRSAVQPKAVEREPVAQLKALVALTESPINRIVRDRMADVENCWLKQPGKHVATGVNLKLAVENGMVVSAKVEGELPKGLAQCITAATDRWAFPVIEGRAEIEQGIQLNAVK